MQQVMMSDETGYDSGGRLAGVHVRGGRADGGPLVASRPGMRDPGPLQGHFPTILHPTILHRNVQRFPGGLVFKAHRLVYHSTLGWRVLKKKKKKKNV